MEADSVRLTSFLSKEHSRPINKLVVFAIHQRAKRRAIIRKPNPSRHGNGDPVASTISHKIALAIHSMSSEQPVETEGAEGDAKQLFSSVQRHQNSPLIVDHSCASH